MNKIKIFKRLYKDYTKKYLDKIILSTFFSILLAGSTSAIAWLLDPAVKKIFIEQDNGLENEPNNFMNDADNLISLSAIVTITAAFSESLLSTPTISLSGLVTSVLMTRISSTNSYTYLWSVSPTTNSGIYTATVSGSDLQGNYNSGTQSITFTVDSSSPSVTITTSDSDNTIKPGDQITITATFSEAMGETPTISIAAEVNNK